jgi:hypothetical protein
MGKAPNRTKRHAFDEEEGQCAKVPLRSTTHLQLGLRWEGRAFVKFTDSQQPVRQATESEMSRLLESCHVPLLALTEEGRSPDEYRLKINNRMNTGIVSMPKRERFFSSLPNLG